MLKILLACLIAQTSCANVVGQRVHGTTSQDSGSMEVDKSRRFNPSYREWHGFSSKILSFLLCSHMRVMQLQEFKEEGLGMRLGLTCKILLGHSGSAVYYFTNSTSHPMHDPNHHKQIITAWTIAWSHDQSLTTDH